MVKKKVAVDVPTAMRVSRRFLAWFSEEKKRRGLTARGLCDELALTYVLKNQKKGAVSWPQD